MEKIKRDLKILEHIITQWSNDSSEPSTSKEELEKYYYYSSRVYSFLDNLNENIKVKEEEEREEAEKRLWEERKEIWK